MTSDRACYVYGIGYTRPPMRPIRLLAGLGIFCLSGCAALIGSVAGPLMSDLSDALSGAILESDDPETVRDGAPAYLIMLDALLRQTGENPDLLRAAASLNGAYATAFVADEDRCAVALVAPARRRPDHPALVAFGKHHAARGGPHAVAQHLHE